MTNHNKSEILYTKQIRNSKFPYVKSAFLLTLLLFFNAAHAAPGDAGAAFLKIPVDARIVGAGEAGVASAAGAAALYYNPAGLSHIEKYNILFMHNSWIAGMYHEYFAAGFQIKKFGALGLSFNYVGSGKLPRITIRGDTIGEFSASDWALGAGYGRDFGALRIGLGFKYMSEKNDSFGSGAFAADLGATYDAPVKGLRAGLSLCNLGTKITLDQESFSLPWLLRFGLRYEMKSAALNQEFLFSNAAAIGIGLGAEYRIAKVLALRLGYRTGPTYEGFSGLRAGLGIAIRKFAIDYAFAPYGLIGSAHRFTLSFGL